MKTLAAAPTLVEPVRAAILAEVAAGGLPPDARSVQDQIAASLGADSPPARRPRTRTSGARPAR